MKYRYSLVDDQSDLIVGYCNRIEGLTGKIVERDNELYHKIMLYDFTFCDEFKEHIKKNKEKFSGLVSINILDTNMNTISSFHFVNHTNMRHTEFYSLLSHIDFELIGYLTEITSKNELKLWEEWIYNFPKQKNEWVTLNCNGRRDWLRMLRITYCCGYKEVAENNNNVFYLDGKNITTYESFFIAFAETINGPGTYFGACLDGFEDCLCGGFGVTPPFKLIWENSLVAVKHLNENEWMKHRLYLKKYNKKIFNDDTKNIALNLNIFNVIIGILLRHNIEVILMP